MKSTDFDRLLFLEKKVSYLTKAMILQSIAMIFVAIGIILK